jgi:hypothetical protein
LCSILYSWSYWFHQQWRNEDQIRGLCLHKQGTCNSTPIIPSCELHASPVGVIGQMSFILLVPMSLLLIPIKCTHQYMSLTVWPDNFSHWPLDHMCATCVYLNAGWFMLKELSGLDFW